MADQKRDMVDVGHAAVGFAQQVRKLHRRRTSKTSAQRANDIKTALERLKEAMEPIRSEIGRFPYGPQTDAAEERREAIRECSVAIQRERRKLWKMQSREELSA